MDFWEAVERRCSIREFDVIEDVPQEVVEKILKAAIRAPSAGNVQPWFFFIVRNMEIKKALAKAAWEQQFIIQAPVAIVVCTDLDRALASYGRRGENLYCIQDTAAAVEHILLGATAQGLGSCWVGAFNEDEVTKSLKLPPRLRPVAIIPIGRAAEPLSHRQRRSLSEVSSIIE